MGADPKTVCEKCGGGVRRVVTNGTGLIFHGTGFYITDYGRVKKEQTEGVE